MIRRATEADIPALQRLLGQILEVHHQARPDLFKKEGSKFSDDELRQLLADDHKPVFVYEDKGAIIGHLFLEIKVTTSPVLEPIKSLFIDDLCVYEDGTGKGIGQQFYDFSLAYAKEEGCYNLTLNVWNDNLGALRFYQNQGMKPLHTQMEVIL